MAGDVQKRVQETIDRMVDSGEEVGVQVAVYRRGETVVDAVAGVADPSTGRKVTSDTPFYNFSICKAAASTIVHMLAERGLFTYETPVAALWPEFAAHGKQKVTIRQVLNHSAGVPGIPMQTTMEDLCDWNKMCAAIADEELWWEPGTQLGYHAYTFGYLTGEIVRRARARRSRKCSQTRSRVLWVWPESCISVCRSRSTTAWRDWKTRRARPAQCRSFRPTCRCSRLVRCPCFRPPRWGTAQTSWPRTYPPVARPRRVPSLACMPLSSARSTECVC